MIPLEREQRVRQDTVLAERRGQGPRNQRCKSTSSGNYGAKLKPKSTSGTTTLSSQFFTFLLRIFENSRNGLNSETAVTSTGKEDDETMLWATSGLHWRQM